MTFTEIANTYREIGKTKKCTFIFCADHGVAKMNVSAYPQSTTASMVKNYLVDQGSAANAFAKFARSELAIVDVGVNADISNLPGIIDRKIAYGTDNIAEGPAMTRAQAIKSLTIGKKLAEKAIKAGFNCFLIGEMGIANTTVAAAITSAITGLPPKKATGRGSNISDERFRNKLRVVRRALKVNEPDPFDAMDVLTKVGGFEFGAMAGVMIAAANHDCVVILDGFNTAVAALIADMLNSKVQSHLIASHIGREPAHIEVIRYLELQAMMRLDLALGEAIGSSIAAKILDNLVYVFVCSPEDDFEGNLQDFNEDDEETKVIENFLSQLGLQDIAKIDNIEEFENFLEDNFGDNIKIEEVDLDFQLADDQRLESFTPPFSAQDFNIPRSYPMLIREMGAKNDEPVAATDKTFNFYLSTMPKLNFKSMENCREYLDNLTKPQGSLGLLEDIAIQIAGITNEGIPINKLRHAALAFTNTENSPSQFGRIQTFSMQMGKRRNVSLDFSMTARTFGMKLFLGVVDKKQNPTVAFNFGRNLAEEISFGVPIIALTALSDWQLDKMEEKFARALLKKNGDLKVAPEDFLNQVPKNYRCLAGAIIGAMVSAAHNSTLIALDCGIVEIIARYLEKLCPEIRPFLLYSTKLINYAFKPGTRIGFDGEAACIGVEIVEAALTALNEMKTFSETGVEVAVDGKGAEVQTK